MVAKKVITISLLCALPTSFISGAAASSGTVTFQKHSLPATTVTTTSSAPDSTKATSTTSTAAVNPDANFTMIPLPVTALGVPYPTVTIDPAKQKEPFRIGRTPLDGNHKGPRETSLQFIKRIEKEQRLEAALEGQIRIDQKTRERLSESLIEAVTKLSTTFTNQTKDSDTSIKTQETLTTLFCNARKAASAALLAKQRATLLPELADAATVLAIVHTMSNAKGSLSDACIKDELAKLKALQEQKEKELETHSKATKNAHQQLADTFKAEILQQNEEYSEQISAIYHLRKELHSAHPAPSTLVPISPRNKTAAPAAAATTTTEVKVSEQKTKKS